MKENSIEEDIKILKSIIKINNDYLKGVENQTINQKEIKALEHILRNYKRLLKENKELRESNKKLYEIGQEMCKQDKYTRENYISVQKVKDKIRYYQELQDNYIKKYDEINEGLQAMIKVLQKLIEESEK